MTTSSYDDPSEENSHATHPLPAEPCGPTDWVDPGPGVDDLAEALGALGVWETTQPRPVTIGGREGVSMELNVPEHLPDECADALASFRDHAGGTQGIGPGKTQHRSTR